MRRALLPVLPALTRFYGLEPEAFERMTAREIDEYLVYMEEASHGSG